MKAIIIGHDPDGLGDALESQGASVAYADGTASREQLLDAGVETADLLAVTDVGLATSIPVAREVNSGLRIVVYARDSLPEFARAVAGLIVDPDLVDTETIAEELQ